MCGIVGYIGKRKVWPILVEGLKRWSIADMIVPERLDERHSSVECV